MLAQTPYLAVRAVSVAGRVEDHGVVAMGASQFAAGEFRRVLGDPADRRAGQPGTLGVAPGPLDHVSRRVDVRDLRPGRGTRERAPARIGEQVQHPDRLGARPHPAGKPVPVCRLLGKQAHVARFAPLQFQADRPEPDRPSFREPGP